MRKNLTIFITLSSLVSVLFLNSAHATVEWSGVFRFEGNHIKNSELGDRGKEKTYGLNHLVLRPKIVASDGITIYSQFNIFNNDPYKHSQLGQVWGGGVGGNNPGTGVGNSNGLSDNHEPETVQVSQLYGTWNHEFGQLIVGRAPLHFGLGISHNAGRGLFDHWYDTRDLAGYKFIVGNLYFLPMFGKVNEGLLNRNDDLNDYMIQVQYENPESDIEMGVFYQMRKGGDQASDVAPSTAVAGDIGGAGARNTGEIDGRFVNVYALRDSERFRAGLEATFQSGETGVLTTTGEKVTWGGFGVATELEYRPEASSWVWGLKAGTASGDDPTTDAKFEGFVFDRNYDVAMLLFNHPLGQADFLRTGAFTGTVRDAQGFVNQPDVEAISNVLYVAPKIKYKFNDRWDLDNTFITGWLGTTPIIGADVSKDLGYEWDISLNFTPRKGVMWVNQVGLLSPGDAWKAGGTFDSSFGFGITTKAAISF